MAEHSDAGTAALLFFAVWLIVGLFLDGWAHSERRPDSFFTPWHGVLYSGLAGGAIVWIAQVRRHAPHTPWIRSLRDADGVALVGFMLFGVGAAGDLAWHEAFGIEVNLAAVLSPTHLVLIAGGVLAFSGPFRAQWHRRTDPESLRAFVPALLSLALAVGIALFFTFYASPFRETVVPALATARIDVHDLARNTPDAFVQVREMWALTAILLTTFLVLAPVVVLTRRWHVPAGSLVVYFTTVAILEGSASEFRRWPLAVAPLVAGVLGELLVRRRANVVALGATLAASLWGAYFAMIALVEGLAWDVELWSGAIVFSTVVGAGLGALAMSGPSSETAAARALVAGSPERTIRESRPLRNDRSAVP